MGFVTCITNCVNCHNPFGCNPNLVPSIRVNGVREAVCRNCIETANVQRKEMGMEPFEIRDGAYEAADENEVF